MVLSIIFWTLVALMGALNAWAAHNGEKCTWTSYFCVYFILVVHLAKWGF